MEDATSALYSLFLVDEEGTASSLRSATSLHAALQRPEVTGLADAAD
jgi:hypothetical protein